ncbi:ATP-binding protein [Actinomadura sp. K4S16]|uniref:ATP-binding protein n=1 Tax=Actinomadura sp. K4S16 TaxID=1316147 RepID=UPI0011EEC825|nr:ATP-binding protein [Actinomadura sp. K4S16]
MAGDVDFGVRPGKDQVREPSEDARRHAGELTYRLASRGLRASAAELVGKPAGAMAVSAQRVDVHPYVGRLVVLLPGPGDTNELYWHWQRPFRGRRWIGARWFQAFAPAAKPEEAADAIVGAIDIDVRDRARSAHVGVESGRGDCELEEQFLTRLGRPLHLLVYRTLALLDSVEREVEDIVLLHELFKIDHLTTRTLRGLERQAVLGGATARQVNEPLTLAKVMRQAVAQIEHYRRVRVHVPPPDVDVDLPGYAGPEITLLLAELVENATKFSPPDARVQMKAVPTPSGVSIEITDRGLPISADAYAALNRLLADPDTVSVRDQIIAGPIGLLVVSRLAQRHGIQVSLHPVVPEGTRAVVALPAALLKGPRPTTPQSATPARAAGLAAQPLRPVALLPLASTAPSQLALPRSAVTSPTEPPGPPGIAAPPGADSTSGMPELPQRRRGQGPQRSVADVAAGAEGGQQPATESRAGQGQGPQREDGPNRGPVPSLLADFAGAGRPRNPTKYPADHGPADSASPSSGTTVPAADPPAGDPTD